MCNRAYISRGYIVGTEKHQYIYDENYREMNDTLRRGKEKKVMSEEPEPSNFCKSERR